MTVDNRHLIETENIVKFDIFYNFTIRIPRWRSGSVDRRIFCSNVNNSKCKRSPLTLWNFRSIIFVHY